MNYDSKNLFYLVGFDTNTCIYVYYFSDFELYPKVVKYVGNEKRKNMIEKGDITQVSYAEENAIIYRKFEDELWLQFENFVDIIRLVDK